MDKSSQQNEDLIKQDTRAGTVVLRIKLLPAITASHMAISSSLYSSTFDPSPANTHGKVLGPLQPCQTPDFHLAQP